MAAFGIPEFLDGLTQSQLLTEAQLVTLRKQLTRNKVTAEGLARVLVRQQHLTEWQARQLLKGQTGFVLNHYRLLNPIGRGGMGHVFRALDLQTGNVVAVKVMARKLTGNQTLVSRFRREIRASSRLNSPGIVRTLDAGRVGNVDFMVMEYVNGDQVDRIASRLGRVPIGIACEIIRQIAAGLQHAHENQMVHRDIKPGNMMVHWNEDGSGIARLMDMGLVRIMSDDGDDGDDHTVTRAGQVMGTPDYMSPEQGWDTTQVDIRSDIYSLGCTLFRLLTGKIPFTGSNPLQVLSQRLQRDAPSVLSVCDDIPQPVADIVSKMTKRDPEARYQTPADVAMALAEFGEPLTKQALQLAVRRAVSHAELTVSDPQDDEVDETDVSYQQFLTEVQHGGPVDLLLTTDVGASWHADTLTLPQINVNVPEVSADSPPAGNRKRQPGLVLTVCAVALVVIAGGTAMLTKPDPPADDPQAAATTPVPPPASGRFLATEPENALTGATWTFTPQTKTDVATGRIEYEIGSIAPTGISIDAATGRLNWEVPPKQSVGTYTVPLKLIHVTDNQRQILDETELRVSVEINPAVVRLPERRPILLEAGEEFSESWAVDPAFRAGLRLSYRVTGSSPAGFRLQEKSGRAEWTPSEADFGRHVIRLAVFHAEDSEPLDQQDVSLIVLPATAAQVLPKLKPQTVKAGDTLRVQIPPADLPDVPRTQARRLIEVAAGAPAGVTISPDNRELIWQVPADFAGMYTIPLQAKLLVQKNGRLRDLRGTVSLKVEVLAGEPPTPGNSEARLPPEEVVSKAADELRETYKSRLAAARTLAQKTALAGQLLELTYDAQPGVSDAALLQLIQQDLASRSRAVGTLFEIEAIRASRYGTDELLAVEPTLKLVRRTSLDPVQQDMAVEHGLRLAELAARSKNFMVAESLLEMITGLLRGSSSDGAVGQFLAELTEANRLAADLAKSADDTTAGNRAEELERLMSRWQFTPLFATDTDLRYFAVSTADSGPVNGRELWKISPRRIRLEADTQQAAVGFLDPTLRLDRFVLRMDIGPETTSAQFVTGAGGADDADFKAFGIVLDETGPGQIINIRDRSTVTEPVTAVRLLTDQANRVEIVADAGTVLVRINGVTVTQAQNPALFRGRIGLAANLGSPEPRVLIRHVRILKLPDTP